MDKFDDGLLIFPALAMAILLLCLNLFGDALREAIDAAEEPV